MANLILLVWCYNGAVYKNNESVYTCYNSCIYTCMYSHDYYHIVSIVIKDNKHYYYIDYKSHSCFVLSYYTLIRVLISSYGTVQFSL